MLQTLVGRVLLQNAQDILWGLTVFAVCRGRNKGAAMEVFPAPRLHGGRKEDSAAVKLLAPRRTWHCNKEQDFVMLNAVQADPDAALLLKDL